MIPVTKPYLPNQSKYLELVKQIFQKQWLTNNGPLVQEYESALKQYLGIEQLLYVSNGTIALQLAIKALGLEGEVITTPFSYVATTSSIVWEGCQPVFVDIDEQTFNIDPLKIEAAITEKTSAILATHCFGNACDIDYIDAIAKKHGLKVIYDAAHSFGTQYKGKSIFEYGDITTCSLHATKLIHSVEGGLVFASDSKLIKLIGYMRNFGHDGPEKYNGLGINGKNSEFHAAMGLCVLEDSSLILSRRKEQAENYNDLISDIAVKQPKIQVHCSFNYAYFPIVLESEAITLNVIKALAGREIFPRRYFYPSLNQLDYVIRKDCKVSESISSRILCLPVFHDLTATQQIEIVSIIKKEL
jgi:dTDP-4-amino-4,6-dideoxygalactose transaminase